MKKNITLTTFLLLIGTLPLTVRALDTPAAGTSYSYPLPAQAGGTVNIVYNMQGLGTAQILAYNEASNLVINFSDTKAAGLQASQVDLCCLPPGVYLYLVLIHYDSGSQEKLKPAKFVVVR